MKYLSLLLLLAFSIMNVNCNEARDLALNVIDVDSDINEAEANLQDFDSVSPVFGMKVAVRDDVDVSTQEILDALDEMAADILQCQFQSAAVGLDDFSSELSGDVSALSDLRVFVVPVNFGCDAVDRTICAGIFYPSTDLIVIAEGGIGRCGQLPLWKHELGHRYGMTANHSNQSRFEPCIDPPDCAFGDIIDVGSGG
ncbi:MAG: hypothetical protein ACT4NX_07850 [Deltaproteobacteria bacterium]